MEGLAVEKWFGVFQLRRGPATMVAAQNRQRISVRMLE
jgi:hypothetical protein